MTTETLTSCVQQIGETAGDVWKVLDRQGPVTIARLVKELEAPRDLVMQALGWLAREEKIGIEEESRSKVIYLR